ncbi:hypothetical protein CY34DRAFT_19809 [Suillus luteus UH-Slu-Lm8-n1]|uniref:Uncharacterized protein n=1 Tax=Suillus luteus UH-Slu-Lm8-n1 TaxID=930992 RepID=A0A0C9ZQI5_9AGAM|nr:hypothetical protein CY34DRAFT_19809 [Suillus luteus UH-Slu-Lm8-n1]
MQPQVLHREEETVEEGSQKENIPASNTIPKSVSFQSHRSPIYQIPPCGNQPTPEI